LQPDFGRGMGIVTCLIFLVSIVLSLQATARAEVGQYRFSPVNQWDINNTAAYWNPIIKYVSDKSGVRLELKIGRTSADTTAYVLTREVEFAFTNHLFSPEREQLGWKVFGRRWTPPIHAQIAVPADSPITTLEELKGQEVVFAGPEAFIGYKVSYSYLLSKGVDIKVVFAGNQNAAFAQLFAGKSRATGSNSALIDGYAQRESKKFRILWTSEGFHDLALMASSKVPEKDVRAVASAFIGMHRDPVGKAILLKAFLAKPFKSNQLQGILRKFAPPGPAADAFDYGAGLLREDAEIISIVAEEFLAACPNDLATLSTALDAGNRELFERTAHSLKGNCAIFGASPMVQIARRLEIISRENVGETEARALIPVLEKEYSHLTAAMQAFLEVHG
jgi:phosphonate transport system substrate-binding protein